MKRIVFGFGAAVCAGILVLTAVSGPRAAADVRTTQMFDPAARFALMAARVSVRTLDEAGPVTQDALFRIDTRSGQVWVYQGRIQNLNRPEIIAAEWIPVRDAKPDAVRRE